MKANSTSPIDRAIELAGGLSVVAEACGVSVQAVHKWRVKRPPADRCPSIERLVSGAVLCEELRPDVDWAYLRQSGTPHSQAQQSEVA